MKKEVPEEKFYREAMITILFIVYHYAASENHSIARTFRTVLSPRKYICLVINEAPIVTITMIVYLCEDALYTLLR